MPLNGRLCRSEESNRFQRSFSSDDAASEDPITPLMGMEVFLLNPSPRLVVVSFSGPLPQHLKDGTIDILEGFLAHDVLVIACPTANERIELQDQVTSRRALVFLHRLADFLNERFNVFLRRFDDKLSMVLAYVLPKEIETVGNMRDEGFLG